MNVQLQVPPCQAGNIAVSSLGVQVKMANGSDFPLTLTKAKLEIDWEDGAPVKLTIDCVAGFEIVNSALEADVFVTAAGVRYRLIDEDEVAMLDAAEDMWLALRSIVANSVIDDDHKLAHVDSTIFRRIREALSKADLARASCSE